MVSCSPPHHTHCPSPLSLCSGTALQTGITYRVDEQQVLRTFGCKNSSWSIVYNATALSASFSNDRTASSLAQTLMRIIPGHMPVQVERFDNASGPSSILDQVRCMMHYRHPSSTPLINPGPDPSSPESPAS